jgi:hypothetical protein
LLAALVGLSMIWAPIAGPAQADFERVLLYTAVLAAAAAFLWLIPTLVEPALAAGIVVVLGYGLSERLLPGAIHLSHSAAAGGRLQQPLTYWNAMGALAAIGVVLCARLAGTGARPGWLRAAAAAATPLLAVGLWLTFSRGALAATLAGLVVLALVAPARDQLRSLALLFAASVPAVALTGPLRGVRSYDLDLTAREHHGLALLAALLILGGVAAAAQLVLARREAAGLLRVDPVPVPRRWPLYAGLAVALIAGTLLTAALRERHPSAPTAVGATSQRLGSVESNRYAYWKVALDVFAEHPLVGDGSHSFQVDWLERRKIADIAKDAHSLYFETAAELGIAGLIALALFLGGVTASAGRALRRDTVVAAGPVAALSAWGLHAGLDWDWEMPGVSLVAIVLMGALIAWGERDGQPAAAAAGARRRARSERRSSSETMATPASTTITTSAAIRKRGMP